MFGEDANDVGVAEDLPAGPVWVFVYGLGGSHGAVPFEWGVELLYVVLGVHMFLLRASGQELRTGRSPVHENRPGHCAIWYNKRRRITCQRRNVPALYTQLNPSGEHPCPPTPYLSPPTCQLFQHQLATSAWPPFAHKLIHARKIPLNMTHM